jgi:hypothetical protein
VAQRAYSRQKSNVLDNLTGVLLTKEYDPDASQSYQITLKDQETAQTSVQTQEQEQVQVQTDAHPSSSRPRKEHCLWYWIQWVWDIDYLLYWTWTITCVFNFGVILSLDSLYIYIVLNYSGSTVTLTQVALALAKLAWNETLVFHLLFHVKSCLEMMKQGLCSLGRLCLCCGGSDCSSGSDADITTTGTSSAKQPKQRPSTLLTAQEQGRRLSVRDVTVLSFLSIINKIVAPCIAIALINSNCFYYALFAAPAVTADIEYCNTNVEGLPCVNILESAVNGRTYNPPFLYSYQCSSFFLTDYVPVFVYMFAFSSIFLPFVLFCLQNLHDLLAEEILLLSATNMNNPAGQSGGQQGKHSGHTSILIAWSAEANVSNNRGQDMDQDEEDEMHQHGRTTRGTLAPNQKTLGYWSTVTYNFLSDWLPQTWQCPHAVSTTKNDNRSRILMMVNTKQRIVIRINNHLAILVTFAVLFPPLAILDVISIGIITYFEERNTSRLLHHANMFQKHWLSERIERECHGMTNSFRYTIVLMMILAILLFAYFIFDTIEVSSLPSIIFICIFVSLWIGLYASIEHNNPALKVNGVTDDEEEEVLELDTFKTSLSNNSSLSAVNPMLIRDESIRADRFSSPIM